MKGAETGPAAADAFVTIAHAARRLGVTEQKLRRLLARPEHAGRTVSATHRTRTGTRRATLLPECFVGELGALFEHETNAPANPPGKAPGTVSEHSGEGAGEHAAIVFTGEAPGPLVRALLGQYEARIGDLKSEVEALRAALEREQQNHARTQTLRALAAPPPMQEPAPEQTGPGRHAGGPTAGDGGPEAAEARPSAQRASQGERPRRAWWPWHRRA